MNRTSRVPYHQNVYDLLGIEPTECPEAAQMIAGHEAAHGPLPASVREWYLLPGVGLWRDERHPHRSPRVVWLQSDKLDNEVSASELERVLANRLTEDDGRPFPGGLLLYHDYYWEDYGNDVIHEHFVATDQGPDPVVWKCTHGDMGRLRKPCGEFSAFVYSSVYWVQYRSCGYRDPVGYGLRTPAEPFAVPVVDFLTEQFGEPERTPRPGDVTTHTWRPDGGTLRVTADHPAHPDPLSAWWVHATSPEQLALFARLLGPWGTLRQTLRADTDDARAVWSGATGLPDARGDA
ncbi:MAG: hypothetical protein K2V38_28560 [Gemmataceae bacterium]|nr:hypothetical protein [Gemmataceae bacterium]